MRVITLGDVKKWMFVGVAILVLAFMLGGGCRAGCAGCARLSYKGAKSVVKHKYKKHKYKKYKNKKKYW